LWAALFAFIRFTANRCSKSDSLTRAPCQRIHLRRDQVLRPLCLPLNRCLRIRLRRQLNCSRRPVGDADTLHISRFPEGRDYSLILLLGNKKRSAGSTLVAQAASL
jgi:hypothetical protein